jgi:hypothetical protein
MGANESMTIDYIIFNNLNDCERINKLLFDNFVCVNGEYLFPFQPETSSYGICYLNPEGDGKAILLIDERIELLAQSNEELATLLLSRKTRLEVEEMGWFSVSEEAL